MGIVGDVLGSDCPHCFTINVDEGGFLCIVLVFVGFRRCAVHFLVDHNLTALFKGFPSTHPKTCRITFSADIYYLFGAYLYYALSALEMGFHIRHPFVCSTNGGYNSSYIVGLSAGFFVD